MMEHQAEKRFHNLTLEQIQALDQVLTEVIPIHGRGNFPTLQVRAKDFIRVVKDRLIERDIQVKDIRLNGATASHILVRDKCVGYRDLDIIFGVELPRQEDLQVIKEVVLDSLRDLLPCGVNRRKITCLTMKEAYVRKMVKVFNEHDRWSLISLSNNRAKHVGLRFISSLRRQFEFSVDSFQIILDRMLESYWETERKQGGKLALNARNLSQRDSEEDKKESVPREVKADVEKDSGGQIPDPNEAASVPEKGLPHATVQHVEGKQEVQEGLEHKTVSLQQEQVDGREDVHSEEDIVFELCDGNGEEKGQFHSGSYHTAVSTHRHTQPLQPPSVDSAHAHGSNLASSKPETALACQPASTPPDGTGFNQPAEQTVKPKHSKKPPDSRAQSQTRAAHAQPPINEPPAEQADTVHNSWGASPWAGAEGGPAITVEAECMFGDFEQAMDHLRHRLIATRNPEEIRGGGLLKYSDLLVRNFRPASETEIKSLERYMCSRFFIDFPDVSEQQRKIEAYVQSHFLGNEETSKYDYLMTLRRVIDESTVCLMGHERRQTLNMITVLALRVLGEQNAIPNTANVTCFYQPAPYVTEPIYSSYFISQAQPLLIYHPYPPLHVHMQTGLV
ncbi:terminal nucleotidyltransferase 5C-like [Pseudoliparis swirei]|uniref:terminal nucleotidyltransferase 5C-like n=1 Tax=Pseudoliparis swirei TaxID=2059687 RepID=UPI0024BEDD84|nr:terminal nucleotidyltransferase 5C-like [Pseudoliparis swirei]